MVKFGQTTIYHNDVASLYENWDAPAVIVSDGGYGVSGFKGDAHTPADLTAWYAPHIAAWSRKALAGTTLWFWNTEIGWALVHPLLAANGWEYVCCNVWNKGLQHIAGNCNLARLRSFPIVTEVCVQYVKRPEFHVAGRVMSLKEWLRAEWQRTKLPLSKTNEACGVANAATRKYFTKDHLWYAPPPEIFEKLALYANQYGTPEGRPYFSVDGQNVLTRHAYSKMFAKFEGQYGVTNVWEQPPLHSQERMRLPDSTKYAHLNQKPLKLIKMLLEVSSHKNDVVWEPFGGLCTVGLAAYLTDRMAFSAEIDRAVYELACTRLRRYTENLFMSPTLPLALESAFLYADAPR